MIPAALASTEAAQKGFYPTPPSVAGKMLEGLDLRYIFTVLEPSAGKGDLADALIRAHYRQSHPALDIDLVELDPDLRAILRSRYGEEGRRELLARYAPLDRMGYSSRSEAQQREHTQLRKEIDIFDHAMVHVVHDDFFTYRTWKHYDLVLMNPPFSNGDYHLLKAIEQQRDGGKIICLLNAETIRNPCTEVRRTLLRKLKDLGAEMEYLEDAFSGDAERKARVDVVIVRIDIPVPERESSFYEGMRRAVDRELAYDEDYNALIPGDYLEQLLYLYNVEVGATMEFVREYRALKSRIARSFDDENYSRDPIIKLVVDNDSTYSGFDYGKYMRMVRMKYWRGLFSNKAFTGKLTSELQRRYREQVEKMADYEFSLFNIRQVELDMKAAMLSGIEKAIMDLFEKLTAEHSWYPECSVNRHYFNGWATNKAHKIGKKCIIPTYGMFSNYSWEPKTFNVSTAYEVISDIEKALDYLDGGRTDEYDLLGRLNAAEAGGVTRNIRCKYFNIDIFKKGTTHIKFHPESMELVERLNIYAARKKNWLPPNYGRTAYSKMEETEKAVVDSFHGDGSAGSGESAYGDVLRNAAYFLDDPARRLPALAAAGEE